jgi:eukaryotic-like serine/threonine-protein kinase
VSAPSFQVIRELGSGGMGRVFLARTTDERGERWVALKRIRSDLGRTAEFKAQFEREGTICSLLNHESVVSQVAWGEDDDGPYLALEYVPGETASRLLSALERMNRRLDVGAALSIARDVAEGLAYAHAFRNEALGVTGVLHRDVSPDNVLVSTDGRAKLTDFGVAKLVGATTLTREQTLKGKLTHMAPELFDGHPADALCDVFSAGVLLYQLLAGVPPFSGRNEGELLRAVLWSSGAGRRACGRSAPTSPRTSRRWSRVASSETEPCAFSPRASWRMRSLRR